MSFLAKIEQLNSADLTAYMRKKRLL